MTSEQFFEKRTLQGALYSGIALIIISMLFFMQGVTATSVPGQIVSVLIVPAIFYGIGLLVYRYLNAPLAAPGIVATGAWLIGVALIHLYDRLVIIAESPHLLLWLICSVLAAILITITGFRIRIWMMVPLVPIAQINALWALFILFRTPVIWFPVLSMPLVFLWWILPIRDERWKNISHVSGLVLGVAMLLFSLWIPFSTPQSLFITWVTPAIGIMMLGFRHQLMRFIPFTVMLLAAAIILGLPSTLWAFMLFVLSISTLVYVERSAARLEKSKDVLWAQLSFALGLVFLGLSALLAELSPLMGIQAFPYNPLWLLLGVGIILIRIGLQREQRIAIHSGLWLLASVWAHLYFSLEFSIEVYGLWLILFAACVLWGQRLITSRYKDKQKSSRTVVESMVHWPGADLALGLSMITLCWTAAYITVYTPYILTLTFSITIGVWVVTSLIYRIPILLHLSLWIAPIPFAMLMMLVSPVFWTLPVLGLAWQFFGIVLLVIGHSTPRYRPVMRIPFFITGYALLVFGFMTAINYALLFPVSLTILILVSIATAVAVIFDYHPVWNLFVERIAPIASRPYAHRHIKHAFLYLSAWLTAVWLNLLLGYSGLSWSQQGLCLVLFSGLWFVLGTLVGRLPGVVGLPLLSAGWLLWGVGLTQVFYSPAEALITAALGLIASFEGLRRMRDLYWIPVVILQILFTVLQASWLLHLPAPELLLLTAFGLSVLGLVYKSRAVRGGQLTAIIGLILMLVVWKLYPAVNISFALCAWSIAAMVVYWKPRWIWIVQATGAIVLFQFRWHVNPLGLMAIGVLQLIIGAELVYRLRPRRYQSLRTIISYQHDWATPLLLVGTLSSSYALFQLTNQISGSLYLLICLGIAALLALYSARLRVIHLPYAALMVAASGIISNFYYMAVANARITGTRPTLTGLGYSIVSFTLGLAFLGLVIRFLCILVVTRKIKIGCWAKTLVVLWLRPTLVTALIAGGAGLISWLVTLLQGVSSPGLQIVAGIFLTLFVLTFYWRQPQQLLWLWSSLCILGLVGVIVLQTFGIFTPAWATLPTGLILSLLCREINHPQRHWFEYAGGLLWMVGALFSINRANIFSLASIGYFFYVLAFLAYGLYFKRKIPLFSGFVFGAIALIACLGRLNMWFIPMTAGLILLGGTLFLETQFVAARSWMGRVQTFWKRLE